MNPDFLRDPLFSIAITIGSYTAAQLIHRRFPQVHAFIWTTAILLLIFLPLPFPGGLAAKLEAYKKGGDMIAFLLGPATVALAVPLYKNAHAIRSHTWPILVAVAVGGLTAMLTGAGLVCVFHGGGELLRAILPKSVTTPIAVSLVTPFGKTYDVGHLQSLAAALVVVTGLLGAVVGPRFLRLIGIYEDVAVGLAMGTAAHGIGTATVLKHSELQGTTAGLAMALNGVFTSILMIPLYFWLP
ncbi:TPA: LrgB family protein [Candidatus Sumerlaeota bacterium]|jgi:putative effector of murein hydrolase|nr:LrgB family protein [Candidatus Sumerlaeota bacterium]